MNPFNSFDDDDIDFGPAPVIPSRSVLFALSPLGTGTPDQESLVSLIIRTSRAHLLNPRHLVTKVFIEAVPGTGKLATAFFRKDGCTVNGLGLYAELFVSAMSKLTGRQNLHPMTLLPWKDVFPHNGQGLLARHPKWCPACLTNQRKLVEGTRFPLKWFLDAYSVCSTHWMPMEDRCPACGRQQPFFPRYPDQGICHHCRQLLSPTSSRPRGEHSQFELWAAEAIGDMIQRQSELGYAPTYGRFQEFVTRQVEAITEGNRAAFCRLLGFDNHGLRGWLDRNERPSFTQFLALCYALNVMPADIFRDDRSMEVTAQLRNPIEARKKRRACARPSLEKRKELEAILQAILESGDRRSVSSIATELGVRPSCLRYWFPEICTTLSERHRQSAKTCAVLRQEMQCARIVEIVKQIESEGVYPSRRRVTRALRPERISLIKSRLSDAYCKAVRKR